MRVLLVSTATQTSRTGVTAHYNRLLAELPGRVDSVQLITPADAPFLVKKTFGLLRRVAALFGQNGRALYLELESFISIWASVRLKNSGSFDIVHAQDTTSGAAAAIGLLRKVRVITTCHFNDNPIAEYREAYKLNAWTDQRLTDWFTYLFKQQDAFITVSGYTKRTSAFLRPQGAVCTVIHNGVTFPPVLPRQDKGPLTIVNIGTIEPRKNQRLLIDAADELRKQGFTNFQILLLGDGPKRQEWEALVKAKGLEGLVSFLGFQSDVTRFLQQASLYVHTAANESWGYTITEAISAGTPVLALATGGIPEQFDSQKPGLLSAKATASELAEAILRYQHPADRQQLADRQMQYARERFRMDIMIDKHLTFYRDVMNRQEASFTHESTALTV
ncbi:glycosyltransferase family 4 protein [Spirosoma radiotolerans]|uniref:Group 1 glycosyl transferase n=1 Tax=Spirosoma radiotolerans TaxID=1379870 RepID=A0A0E3ZT16_9BACT|nr:glycosyltransferase [Spirosoma radiotolerans]AKD54378.1 hypothetical protein SD10_05080 [Spirosoma radiotolerans]